MTRTWLCDKAPGETRTGLVENGILVEFRISRPHVQWGTGARHDARILSNFGAGKALVLLDNDVEALLANAPKLPEGARLAVELVRPPIPEPGRWKKALVRPAAATWQPDTPIFDTTTVTDRDAIEAAGFDELIDAAVTGEFPIDGGMLSIERTRAMTMIDIDGASDAVALNKVAAAAIPRLLRLFDIGGQVGIDFLAMPDRKARLAVDAALADACAVLGAHERTAINGFGFAQIVRPRYRLSIPEILCGITPGRLSVESRALALLRDASRSLGHGPRTLVAPPAIIDLLQQRPEEIGELSRMLGVAIELVSDAATNGYGHVHVKP
jgi:Ribonuclease E/G family